LFVLDALSVALSLFAAYQVSFRVMEYPNDLSSDFYVHLAWVAIPLWLLIFASYRLYHADQLFGGMGEYAGVVKACTAGLVGLVIYPFLIRASIYQDYNIARRWWMLVWVFSVITMISTRFTYRHLIYRLREQGLFVRRALVVGANEEGRAVVAQLRATPSAGVEVVGFVEPSLFQGTRVEGLPVLSGIHKLDSLIQSLEVEELIVIPTALRREELLDIYRDWGTDSRVRISLSSGLYELFTTGAQVREVGFVPMMSLDRTRITGIDAWMKAAMDYVGTFVGITLLAPVFLFIAWLIRRDSPGPVIHRRRVVGLHGRRFNAYKFRTMIPNADTYLETHPELNQEWLLTGKIQDDPRITRVGRVLRRLSLDELPQLFNVLKGQMSLVGPRMITPGELKHFRRWRHNLLTVKPGMTGLWQVSGRSDLSYEERVRMDMRYIRNYTIWQDIKLLFNTVRTVLKGRGAY
jgi:exopolysaccharide biosynthesis polyprenyl glycosylphosphotransferase